MAETLSPNPTIQKQQRPAVLSPASPFFLGSNDDKQERAEARAAARAAAIRLKTIAAASAAHPETDPCLGKEQILELFNNCIKLASENKINQKNTWELTLIDHLSDIIKVEDDDVETNFQKNFPHVPMWERDNTLSVHKNWSASTLEASCTLEAGVKIYSLRVDSVHSEAYKVLGGINRVGQESEEDGTVEDSSVSNGREEGRSKKEQDRKLSPLSTLESSFEALNVKKFDAAFAVDPLYHQTSAQFDEGGAKGLLLNNLGVYGGCRVLFDSLEVPGKCSSSLNQHNNAEEIDISFARECFEQMILNIPNTVEISPSLRDIVSHFDEDNKRPSDTFPSGTKPQEQVGEEAYYNDVELGGDAFDNGGTWDFDHDDQTSMADEGTYGGEPKSPNHYEENEPVDFHDEPVDFHDPDMDDRSAGVDDYLFLSLGFPSKQNAWAGPDHWKYRKAKGPEDVIKENGSPKITKKPKYKKYGEVDIDFMGSLDKDLSDVFAPPKNPKSLLLPTNREPCNISLPEDCHYQPENLVKLFLLPNVMCLGKRRINSSVEPSQQRDDSGSSPSWGDENGFGDQFDDGNGYSDVDDSNALVSQPRQVNKIEVQYDRTSKQVDVQALKETLWKSLQESQLKPVQAKRGETTISFKQCLAMFPNDCRAAASVKEISPHLCFICLLHLANEHGLSIQGSENLEDLTIILPPHNGDGVQNEAT